MSYLSDAVYKARGKKNKNSEKQTEFYDNKNKRILIISLTVNLILFSLILFILFYDNDNASISEISVTETDQTNKNENKNTKNTISGRDIADAQINITPVLIFDSPNTENTDNIIDSNPDTQESLNNDTTENSVNNIDVTNLDNISQNTSEQANQQQSESTQENTDIQQTADNISSQDERALEQNELKDITEAPPSLQATVYNMEFNGLIHQASSPSLSFVLIDSKSYLTGDEITNGITIEEITYNGIIIKYDQIRYFFQIVDDSS